VDRKIVSPNDGSIVRVVPDASSTDIKEATRSARAAFPTWSAMPANDRAAVMHTAAAQVRAETDSLAMLMSSEMGKPIKQARSEAANVADLIDFFAEEGLRIAGEIPKLDLKNELPLVVKEPVGVVAAISPFNYPIALLTWKLGPALITGCTVVAKPDEHAPSAAMRLAEIFSSAHLPDGVFQVVTGAAEVGAALVESPDVDKVAFTGSVPVGRIVAASAMASNKRVTLELGGQCPAIIGRGADLDAVLPPLVTHTFNNSGQYCYRINRIYVDQSLSDEFTSRFVEAVSRLRMGVSTESGTDIGPLCHEDIVLRSLSHVADARERGGRVLIGGDRATGEHFEAGWFMQPTVIDRATQDMLVMQEETFGPVVGITEVSSMQESIELANDSIYGLAAYVFTGDTGEGLQAALRLAAGSVWVNGVKKSYPQCPFGGYKASGLGREKSHYGLDEYLELKSIYLQLPKL
jgi:succinate-semialdehyde dehydrogenase/glutarate-semialdehyde dehydrogenase